MNFDGFVEVNNGTVKRACDNFKEAIKVVETIVENKIEEFKNIKVPYKFLGVKILYLQTTIYNNFGNRCGAIETYVANNNMYKYIRNNAKYFQEVKDNPEQILYLISDYDTGWYYNQIEIGRNLRVLQKTQSNKIYVNPTQAKFINYWVDK